MGSGPLAVTELVSDVRTDAPSASVAFDDAFLVGCQIAHSEHEMWFDGRPVRSPPFVPGETCFYDLRRDPSVLIHGPYHSLQFYLPRGVLNEMLEAEGGPQIEDLRYQLGAPMRDPVIRHLAASVRPAFHSPEAASGLFLDHVLYAMAAHVAHRYGSGPGRASAPVSRSSPSGLALWQLNRAKEMMEGRLDDQTSLRELAAACGLSVSHFARAFRISTGLPPHRWLLRRRVDRATDLLRGADLSLTEVALACGFADQSHFTRVFAQATGESPGLWRRRHKRIISTP